jgi:hypothetical protein
MNCPHCKSLNLFRLHRVCLLDDVLALVGFWPFACADCRKQFVARRRHTVMRAGSQRRRSLRRASEGGPAMVYRNHSTKPVAKVLIETDDHGQLDQILLALSKAVSSFEPSASRAYMSVA